MLIKYNGLNVHSFPTDHQAKSIITLKPGINEFPSPVWALFKKHPVVMNMIENGLMELMTVETEVPEGSDEKPEVLGAEGDDKPVSLKKLKVKDAVSFAEQTFDLNKLEEWHAEETRVKVKKALESQMKKIHATGEKKKDD